MSAGDSEPWDDDDIIQRILRSISTFHALHFSIK